MVNAPVRWCASTEKSAVWREVLETGFGPAAPEAFGERLVLSWGAGTRGAARHYAAASRSRLVSCATIDDVLRAIAGGDGREAVVVVAFTGRLTVASIARISAACREAGRSLGFLSGRSEAGLSFSVAKALRRPRPELTGLDLLDAPLHRQEENSRRLPADFRQRLTRPSLAKILRSHGEGGHAKLPGVVVCGLPDPAEFPDTPDEGCAREPRRCKRAEATRSDVVFADELAAPVVCFVCCNGFNVAEQLYPSPVSMALSFIEGWAGALIAPIRPLVAPDEMVDVLYRGLAAGRPLGSIVARLNAMSARIGQRDAFVLHGDPCLRLPATDGSGDGPAVVAVDDRLVELRDWLVTALRQAERGRRLLRALRAWLGDDTAPAPLIDRFEKIERLILNTMKWAEISPSGESRQRLLRSAAVIRFGVTQWDRAVSRLLLESRETVDAFDIGHYDQVLAEVRDGAGCARCATPTETHVYGRGEPAADQRLAEMCWVCGPVAERRSGGLGLKVSRCPHVGAGGEEFRLSAELRLPAGAPRLVDSVQVYLRFFDKANDRCVHEEARTVPAEDQTIEFRFRLPDRIGVDLHSVRLVAVTGFDLAYARTRFAGLPAGHRERATESRPNGSPGAGSC
ncbi:MAG TPA: hypothetical protein VFU43_27755 [Streptosporangiaceae bacterium]|nr:hypothetical protein [Streptosporangiaceae bacterium]